MRHELDSTNFFPTSTHHLRQLQARTCTRRGATPTGSAPPAARSATAQVGCAAGRGKGGAMMLLRSAQPASQPPSHPSCYPCPLHCHPQPTTVCATRTAGSPPTRSSQKQRRWATSRCVALAVAVAVAVGGVGAAVTVHRHCLVESKAAARHSPHSWRLPKPLPC